MNLKQLPYILAIEASGNLLSASKELGISQPALTKYLSELENEVGMELFYRVKRQMIPTAAGQLYLDAARKILRLSSQTYESIKALDHQEYQNIRVGISPHRGAAFLARLYPELTSFYPQVRLQPSEGYSASRIRKVLNGEIDFAITSHAGPVPPEIELFTTLREEILLAIPAYYPIAKHSPRTPYEDLPFADLREFEKYSFIMPEKDSALYNAVMPLLDAAGYSPICSFATPNITMEKELIRAGAGIGFVSSFHAAPNDSIAFFRLYQTSYMDGCIIKRKDHELTDAEKFLIYLHMKQEMPDGPTEVIDEKTRALYYEQEIVYRTKSVLPASFELI